MVSAQVTLASSMNGGIPAMSGRPIINRPSIDGNRPHAAERE